MDLKGETIFNWSMHPFEFKSFKIGFDDIKKETTFLSMGIRPVIIVLSVDNQYSTTLELRVWKFSITLAINWWS